MANMQQEKKFQPDDIGEDAIMENLHISQLPPELVLHIFGYLELPDRFSVAQVCQNWQEMISYPEGPLRALIHVLKDFPGKLTRPAAWKKKFPANVDTIVADLTTEMASNVPFCKKMVRLDFNIKSSLHDKNLSAIVYWFKNLKWLQLDRCSLLTDDGIKKLKDLKLEHLGIVKCDYVTNHGLLHIVSSKNLQKTLKSLELRENYGISDQGLVHVASMKNLRKLSIGGFYGNDILNHLADTQREKEKSRLFCLELSIGDWMFSAGFSHISRIGSLRKLVLRHVTSLFATKGLRHLADGPSRLACLDLCYTGITDAAAESLARLPTLRKLSVSGSTITNRFLENLSHGGLSNIVCLNLESCEKLNDDGLIHLANISSLRKLSVQSCPAVGVNGYRNLVSGGSLIECLAIGRITDEVGQPLANMTTLRKLDVSQQAIGDMFLQHLTSLGHSNIDFLVLSFCTNVRDDGFRCVAMLSNLRCLILRFTEITVAGLDFVLRRIPTILYLDVTGCAQLSPKVLEIVAGRLPNLRILKLSKIHVNDDGLKLVGCSLPHLCCFYVNDFNRFKEMKKT